MWQLSSNMVEFYENISLNLKRFGSKFFQSLPLHIISALISINSFDFKVSISDIKQDI